MGEVFKLFGTIGLNNDEANKGIDETTGRAKKSSNKIAGFFKKAAVAIGTVFAVDKIISFGKMTVEAAASAKAIQAQFDQVFGDVSGIAQKTIEGLGKEFGMLPNRLKQPFTNATSMFKGLGMSTEDAMAQAEKAVTAAADAAAFYDVSYEQANGALNSFIKGNYEGGESIGIFANDTQMAQYAIKQGIVGSTAEWQKLDEATKQATRLEYAQNMQEQAGAMGQAARESEGYENVMGNLKQAWMDFQAIIGAPVLAALIPVLQNITSSLQDMGQKAQLAMTWMSEHQTTITLIGIALGTLTALIITYNVQQALATAGTTLWGTVATIATAATTALGTAFAFLTSPIGLIIIAIGALIAAGVALYQNWDKVSAWSSNTWEKIKSIISNSINFLVQKFNQLISFVANNWQSLLLLLVNPIAGAFSLLYNNFSGFRNKVNSFVNNIKQYFSNMGSNVSNTINRLRNSISSTFNRIKSAIQNPVKNAVNYVKRMIDKMKGFFNFNWKLPKLKMPHFSVSGSANPIDWIKQGVPKLKVNWYAKGGIMEKATAFGMNGDTLNVGGEAGREAVLPLNAKNLAGIGAGIAEASGFNIEGIKSMLIEILEELRGLGDRPVIVNVELDGKVIARVTRDPMDRELGKKNRDKSQSKGRKR